jgi:hypothetical protein
MDIRAIRDVIRSTPFQPFTLRMNDGRKFHVAHPESIALGKRTVFVVVPESEIPVGIEPILIATLHINSKKNGRKSP